jgi:predicted DCC family thiol-disulfide oxidoreductase YuxK
VVLFDGVCNLCNGAVQFLIDHDHAGRIRFASLQGPTGQTLLGALGRSRSEFESMFLVEGGRVFDRSTAALRMAAYLDHPWRLAARLQVFPQVARDSVYDLIARRRYAWFGRTESCRVPTPGLLDRFME